MFEYFNLVTMPLMDKVIYFLMLACIFFSFKIKEKRDIFVNAIATLGMIGTFFGICFGLQNFDSENLVKSIPVLLQGMKTAFYTSLIGTSITIFYKIFFNLFERKDPTLEKYNQYNKTFIDHNKIMIKQNHDLFQLLQNQLSINEKIEQYNANFFQLFFDYKIANEQFILSFNDYKQKNGKFISSFEEYKVKNIMALENLSSDFKQFKNSMAKENNEAFVSALNACIKNLNEEMMLQLGENFNKFNEGMIRVVKWQENYIETIQKTEETQNNIFKNINEVCENLDKTANNITTFSNRAESILEVSKALENTLDETNKIQEGFKNNIDYMKEQLINLNNILDSLSKFGLSLNSISTDIENNTTNILHSSNSLNETIENFDNMSKNIVSKFNVILEKQEENSDNIFKNLGNTLNKTMNKINELSSMVEKEAKEISINSALQIESLHKQVNKLVLEHVNLMRTELESALKTSLINLGDELATLSEKFANDYEPLTKELAKIVEIAKKVK